MNYVSACCHKEIVSKSSMEYPLGGRTWGIPGKVDACTGCGDEWPSTVTVCDCCGMVGTLVETRLGYWCNVCCLDHAEELMEREVNK